jgi:hypothetical protein
LLEIRSEASEKIEELAISRQPLAAPNPDRVHLRISGSSDSPQTLAVSDLPYTTMNRSFLFLRSRPKSNKNSISEAKSQPPSPASRELSSGDEEFFDCIAAAGEEAPRRQQRSVEDQIASLGPNEHTAFDALRAHWDTKPAPKMVFDDYMLLQFLRCSPGVLPCVFNTTLTHRTQAR